MAHEIPEKVTNVIVTGKSGAGKQPRIDVLVEKYELEQLSTGDIFRTYLGNFDNYDYDGDLSRFWNEKEDDFIPDKEIAKELGTEDSSVILGMKAKFFVEQGLFVPDRITNALFESFFGKKGYKGQVLDGYPRTLDQSKYLLNLIEEKNTDVDFILWVDSPDDLIIQRTIKRRICPECGKVFHLEYKPPDEGKCTECSTEVIQRSDDTEEKIRSRLNEFKVKTLPAIDYLRESGIPVAKVPGHLEEFTEENVRRSVLDAIEKME